MPMLDTEQRWLLSFQMEHREDGHRAKESVSPALNYPPIHVISVSLFLIPLGQTSWLADDALSGRPDSHIHPHEAL